jgi:glutamate synthase (NADPH/NADH) small chain
VFKVNHMVGKAPVGAGNRSATMLDPSTVRDEFDALVLAGGAEQPRDLTVPGRDLDGIHFAMNFLPLQNRRVAGDKSVPELWATGKHVVVIGGGDTGSDCVGTSNRHGAKSVTQLELLARPEDPERNPDWPYWPTRLRTSSSHEEGCDRDWSVLTKAFVGEGGKVTALKAVRLEWKDGKMTEMAGSEFTLPADLVLLAMGFVSPVQSMLEAFGVEKDARGNVKAATDGAGCYATSVPKVFAAGDMRRGQSLVVWAIREGRQCARAVDEYLMGFSELPR